MVLPFSKPVMILNGNIFTTGNIGTILHETGHVFDFNGAKKKSDMFVPFFSPGSTVKQLR